MCFILYLPLPFYLFFSFFLFHFSFLYAALFFFFLALSSSSVTFFHLKPNLSLSMLFFLILFSPLHLPHLCFHLKSSTFIFFIPISFLTHFLACVLLSSFTYFHIFFSFSISFLTLCLSCVLVSLLFSLVFFSLLLNHSL